jgi:hypothetical protein
MVQLAGGLRFLAEPPHQRGIARVIVALGC